MSHVITTEERAEALPEDSEDVCIHGFTENNCETCLNEEKKIEKANNSYQDEATHSI